MDYSHQAPPNSTTHVEVQYSRSSKSRSDSSSSSRFSIDTSLSPQPIRQDLPHIYFPEAPRTAPLDYSSSFSSTKTAYSPTYTTSIPVPQSAAFIDSPVSAAFSPWDTFSPRSLARRWTGRSDLSTDPAHEYHPPHTHHGAAATALQTGNMSTMAVQYDPSFGTMNRSSFTWPTVLEPEMTMDHLSDTSAVKSEASSPPRAAFTPEQRELKRQQDQARRDSKTSMRFRRTNSHPYASQSPPTHYSHHTPHSPPMTMSDTASAINMTVYTTGPASISLLAEPPTTLPSQQYMQPYSSPPLTEHGQYTPTYAPPMQHGYNMSVDYSSPYSAPSSYDGRQGAMPGMYSVPQVMPSSAEMHEDAHVRIVQSRPKPRCWDHGCNGRQFSTFSNLLRHQREKSGQATKSLCPQCGQSFTRSTARNGHLSQGKCRGRSDDGTDFTNDMLGDAESTDEHNDDQSSSPDAESLS